MKAFDNTEQEKRLSLVYEFDNKSPVFARIAFNEIENNNFDKAEEILKNGINAHPEYASAYFLYAETLAKLGKHDEAKIQIETGRLLLNFNDTAENYLALIENAPGTGEDITNSRGNIFMPGSIDDPANYKSSTSFQEFQESAGDDNIEENLDELAKELDTAKIPPVDKYTAEEEQQLQFTGTEIITETMAKIYLDQGKVKEALDIYEKLILEKPENADYFRQKISDISNSSNQ